jgi:hypothetical protein
MDGETDERLTQILLTAVLIAGCNMLGITSHRNINPEQTIIITDTTVQKATVYHSGEFNLEKGM